MTVRALIMATGTGGHVIPGLAIAQALQARGHKVVWLGTPTGLENQLVSEAMRGLPMTHLRFTGLRGKGLGHAVKNLWYLLLSVGEVARILRRHQINVVVGMGGYICASGALVAWLTRRPLLLVNADATLLLSNQWLRPFAQKIWMGFVEGNPVRPAIEALPPPAERFAHRAPAASPALSAPLRLLVVGGSLGARALNECLPLALARLPQEVRPHVVHQTGAAHAKDVRAAYVKAGLQAALDAGEITLVSFIDDMAAAYAACDLFVGRAGALTISELCAAGVGSILIPFVASTTAHQVHNARWLAQSGAAIVIEQASLTPERLAQTLASIRPEVAQDMACKARARAKPHATEQLVQTIEALERQA